MKVANNDADCNMLRNQWRLGFRQHTMTKVVRSLLINPNRTVKIACYFFCLKDELNDK